MADINDGTMKFKFQLETGNKTRDILSEVYSSLKDKGYNPVNQLVI